MKKNKFLLTTAALLAFLTACGSDDAAPETDTETNGGTEEVVDEGSDSDSEEVVEEDGPDYYQTPEMDFDMDGRVIKIVAWWNMENTGEDPDSIQAQENLEALKEKHNFDVEYVEIEFGEYQERITASLLANEPVGDLVRLGKKYTIPSFVQQDLLWPVGEYVKNPNAFNLQYTEEIFQYEGEGFAFTDALANIVQGVFYNRTLMDDLGLDSIQDYVDSDTWDWEAFKEVVASANLDTNNDGNLDTWGLANPSVLEYALMSNDAALTDGDQQTLDNPATMEAMEFTQEVFEIARPTEGGDWTEPEQFFREGNTLFTVGADWMYDGLKTDMPEYDIGFLPFPQGPRVDGYRTYEGDVQAIGIPKMVENPEQLVYIWEKINDVESIYDYPGQASLESKFTNEADIENARLVMENLTVLDHWTFPNLQYWDMEAELLEGTSVSTIVETYSQPYQAAIDEVYGN